MKNVYSKVDLTLLKPTARLVDFVALCNNAAQKGVASVCVPSCHVKSVSALLFGTNIPICTTVGFPLGNCSTATKVCETTEAIRHGATEIDMVVNIGAVLGGNWDGVKKDISAVRHTATNAENDIILKVIVETCYLNDEQIIQMCHICEELGVDYIKTSTGFGTDGAKLQDVRLMKKVIDENGYNLKIKASGGIRSIADAEQFIAAGASRIGASNLS